MDRKDPERTVGRRTSGRSRSDFDARLLPALIVGDCVQGDQFGNSPIPGLSDPIKWPDPPVHR
jgi:hypothetical protein